MMLPSCIPIISLLILSEGEKDGIDSLTIIEFLLIAVEPFKEILLLNEIFSTIFTSDASLKSFETLPFALKLGGFSFDFIGSGSWPLLYDECEGTSSGAWEMMLPSCIPTISLLILSEGLKGGTLD